MDSYYEKRIVSIEPSLTKYVFGSALAAAWVGSGLVANMFRTKDHRREGDCLVAFGTGQALA